MNGDLTGSYNEVRYLIEQVNYWRDLYNELAERPLPICLMRVPFKEVRAYHEAVNKEAEYIQKAGYFVMLIPANDVTSLQIEVLSVTDMNKIKYEDFTTKMQALYKSIKGND